MNYNNIIIIIFFKQIKRNVFNIHDRFLFNMVKYPDKVLIYNDTCNDCIDSKHGEVTCIESTSVVIKIMY